MQKKAISILRKNTFGKRRLWMVIILSVMVVTTAAAQRKTGKGLTDSLIAELPKLADDSTKLNLYISIGEAIYSNDPNEGIKYGNKALDLAGHLKIEKSKASAYSVLGTSYWMKSDFATALEYYFKGLKICEALGLMTSLASTFGNIALVYTNQNDLPKAAEYNIKALQIYEQQGDSVSMGRLLGNAGNIYKKQDDYTKALEYYNRALAIDEKKGLKRYEATVLVNVADVHTLRREYAQALPYYFKALRLHESLNNKRGIAVATANIGECYLSMFQDTSAKIIADSLVSADPAVNLDRAITNLEKALALLKEIKFAEALEEVHHELAEAYVLKGRYSDAYANYRIYEQIKDSVFSKEKAEAIANLETQREVSLKDKQIEIDALAIANKNKQIQIGALAVAQKNKQIEIDQLALTNKNKQIEINQLGIANKDKNIKLNQLAVVNKQKQIELDKLAIAKKQNERIFFIGGFILLIGIIVYIFRSNKLLSSEKRKSENLLLNILPSEVAEELKSKGMADAKYFDNVTIIFTDFVNFTGAGERMSSIELIQELDICFKAFDGIIGKYNVEKIKTIGDAYLAVSGLPLPDEQHAENVLNAALEIRAFMLNRKAKLGDSTFEIRIGIHTGAVVAGIVGIKKFAYDIWGDTVNTAARMEQNSDPGKINISQTTYELVADKFNCTYRGEVDAKNKGMLKMYFAEAVSSQVDSPINMVSGVTT